MKVTLFLTQYYSVTVVIFLMSDVELKLPHGTAWHNGHYLYHHSSMGCALNDETSSETKLAIISVSFLLFTGFILNLIKGHTLFCFCFFIFSDVKILQFTSPSSV